MIEPYSTILRSTAGHFPYLRFTEQKNSKYSMTFSNDNFALEFITEEYYQPALTTQFYDSFKHEYSLKLLREIYDKTKCDADFAALDLIKVKYRLNETDLPEHLRKLGVIMYLESAVSQIYLFYSTHFNDLITIPDSIKLQYKNKELELLKKIGL